VKDLPTQASPKKYARLLDDLESEGAEHWAAMRARIDSSVDPGTGAADRLRRCAVEAWHCATGEHALEAAVVLALSTASEARLNAFFEQWTRQVYDVAAVTASVDLNRRPPETSLKTYLQERSRGFFEDMFDDSKPLDPVRCQRETALASVAPKVSLGSVQLMLGTCFFNKPPERSPSHSSFSSTFLVQPGMGQDFVSVVYGPRSFVQRVRLGSAAEIESKPNWPIIGHNRGR
jgi:hypothetical protein